jgi:hypothetical protein
MPRKQRNVAELYDAQRRRKSDIQTMLLRIVDGTASEPTFVHRTDLVNPSPYNEVARGELPYEPFEKGLLMLRDAARSAVKLPKERRERVRANIRNFCATLERYALEDLPEEIEADVLPLLFAETRAQSVADEAQDLAKVSLTPDNLLHVAQTTDAEVRIGARLRDACYRAANRGLTLVRSAPLQSVAR